MSTLSVPGNAQPQSDPPPDWRAKLRTDIEANTAPEPEQAFPEPEAPAVDWRADLRRDFELDEQQRDEQLRRSIAASIDADPKFVAEAQQIGLDLNIDPLTVEGDLQGYRQIQRKVMLDRWREANVNPVLRLQMTDPAFARMALDDVEALGELEGIWEAFRQGGMEAEVGELESKLRDHGLTDSEEVRREAVWQYLRENRQPSGWFRDAAKIGGQIIHTTPEIIASSAAMGAGFAATAALAGQMGPQVGTPEEIFTVPGAFAGGFLRGAFGAVRSVLQSAMTVQRGLTLGAGMGVFRSSYQIEGGHIYRDLMSVEGMDEAEAIWMSRVGGVMAGALETVGAGFAAKGAGLMFAPARRRFFRQATKSATEALSKPTIGQAALDVARGALTTYAGEVSTEGLQKLSELTVGEAARWRSGLETRLSTPEGLAEMAREFGEEMAAVAKGMAILSLVPASARVVTQSRRIARARADARVFDKAVQMGDETALKTNSPQAFAGLTQKQVDGGRAENVYVEGERFQQAMEDAGISMEELRVKLPTVAEQLPAALAGGGDIVIPTGEYSATVAGSTLETRGGLRQHTRFDPEGETLAEAEASAEAMPEMVEEGVAAVEREVTFNRSARDTEEVILGDLEETVPAMSRQRRTDSAAVYRAIVETGAADMGVLPHEFAEQYFPVRIASEIPDPVTPDAERTPDGIRTESAEEGGAGRPLQQKVSESAESAESAGKSGDRETLRTTRGEFDPPTFTVALYDGANVTTVLHELAHAYLHMLGQIVVQENAPPRMVRDMNQFLEWRGIEGGPEAWNRMTLEEQRPHHEALAEEFEVYGIEGRAPSLELQGVFSRMKDWIARLWRAMRGKRREVDPFIRGFFDRMLASEDAIAHAEAARGLAPLFEVRPEAMSDAQWEQLERHHEEWVEAAKNSVRKRAVGTLQWLDNARFGLLREKQKEHDKVRGETAAEVRAELLKQPVYRAWSFLRDGVLLNEDGDVVEWDGPTKIRTDDVRAVLFPKKPPPSIAEMELSDAMAALGGLSREAALALGVDPAEINTRKNIAGRLRMVFPKKGKTLDEIRELLAEHGFRYADEAALSQAVLDSVFGDQVFSATRDVAADAMAAEEAERAGQEIEEADKVDLRALKITSPKGLPADQVAGWFNFPSGATLIQGLVASVPLEEAVSRETDRRMVAENADLVDADQIREAIAEAVYNPLRSRVLASELKALDAGATPWYANSRVMIAAARRAAEEILGATVLTVERETKRGLVRVGQIRSSLYQAAERRANRAAIAALARGDMDAAIAAKRNELLQHELARLARKVETEMVRAEKRFSNFTKTDKKLEATRDVEIINAGRALLSAVGALPKPEEGSQTARQHQDGLTRLEQDFLPASHGVNAMLARFANRHWKTMTLSEFRELDDVVRTVWDLSRASQLVEIEGRKMEVKAATKLLIGAINALPKRFAPGAGAVEGRIPNFAERRIHDFWHFIASSKRFQHWALFMDGGNPNGPFQDLMLRPMLARIDQYREKKQEINDRLHARLERLMRFYGPQWDADIEGPNGFQFKGIRQLADVLLDMGNKSNKAKRLVGEGWAARPDENGFVDTTVWDTWFDSQLRTADNPQGVITPELMDWVQSVWSEFEALRPLAQQTHKEVLGYEFEELELTEIALPWGTTLRGGYAPLRVDHSRDGRSRPREITDTIQGAEENVAYSRHSITTGRGFTMARNPNYFRPLTMDLSRRLGAFDDELRFIYIQPHVRNVLRLTRNAEFDEAMGAYDRAAIDNIIHAWLETTARQSVTRPSRHPGMDWIATVLRNGAGLAYLGLNVTVSLVQLTGLGLSTQAISRRYLYSGLGTFLRNPPAAWRTAAEQSIRMRDRLRVHAQKIQEGLNRQGSGALMRGVKLTQQEAARVAWLPLRYMQGIVDVVTWHGAYEQSLANSAKDSDMADAQKRAVQDADLAVERSQGGTAPENLARLESDTPFVRTWFQFLTFSNVLFNNVLVKSGLGESKAAKLAPFVWIPAMITFWETLMREPLEGPPEDEDGDGILDDLAWEYVKNYGRNVAGMVPMVGPSLLAIAQGEADRVAATPAGSVISTLGRVVFDATQGEAPDLRELGVALTVFTGIPVVPITKTLDYVFDVESGAVEPTGEVDYWRGFFTGRASEAARN